MDGWHRSSPFRDLTGATLAYRSDGTHLRFHRGRRVVHAGDGHDEHDGGSYRYVPGAAQHIAAQRAADAAGLPRGTYHPAWTGATHDQTSAARDHAQPGRRRPGRSGGVVNLAEIRGTGRSGRCGWSLPAPPPA